MKAKLDVRMPEAPPLPERHALLSAREPRELRLLVRPHDGAVVLVLRGAGDTGAWEISAGDWHGLVERVAAMQASPRQAGAAVRIAVEKHQHDALLEAIRGAISGMAESD